MANQNSKTVKCQNCQKEFAIEPDDIEFYQKIKVPPPTFCPECRLQRRMMFRNERTLYKRKCGLCGKDIFSMFSLDKPYKVFCSSCWYSDNWNPMNYGREYDFAQPFFKQLKSLELAVPRTALYQRGNINSPWVNREDNSRNCYLDVGGSRNEDCAYNTYAFSCKDILDNLMIERGEFCYENVFCRKVYKVFFSKFCFNCHDTYFSFNCRGCSNIIGCCNLSNQSYCIFNKPVNKKTYEDFFKKHFLGSYLTIDSLKEASAKINLQTVHKFNVSVMAENCLGDFIENCKNCKFCFNTAETENCRYVYTSGRIRDCWDVSSIGINSELSYESISGGGNSSNLLFSASCGESFNLFYCQDIDNSSNLFGCVGLRHKQYCILNKQYTKEEYEELVPKIIEQMSEMPYVDKKGRVYKYGEFFPPELSPFCYNETIAQEYFPLTKEQAGDKGYSWKDQEDKERPQPTLKAQDLPDNIKDVPDTITQEVIQCANANANANANASMFRGSASKHCPSSEENAEFSQCTQVFRIIPQELEFYRKMNLALPRYCPNCRHFQRIKQRNPLKLWHRKCQCAGTHSSNGVYQNTVEHFHGKNPCPNEFETSYSPDRKEIVYCEKCYQREVV